MTANVNKYCTSLTAKVSRRHKEEVERGHAEHGGKRCRAAPEPVGDEHHAQQEQHYDVGEIEVA